MGPWEGKLSTPFQMTDKIKRELVRRAEQTGGRALDWTMSTFNKVGGAGTLRAVWERLKSCHLIRGRKRKCLGQAREVDKKKKEDLDISLICTRLIELLLSPQPVVELDVSMKRSSRSDIEWSDGESQELPRLTSSSGSSDSDSGLSPTCVGMGDRIPLCSQS